MLARLSTERLCPQVRIRKYNWRFGFSNQDENLNLITSPNSKIIFAVNVSNIVGTDGKREFISLPVYIGAGIGIIASLVVDRTRRQSVVICETQFIDGGDGTQYNVDYIDPWDNSRQHCSYEDFRNGRHNSMVVANMIYSL